MIALAVWAKRSTSAFLFPALFLVAVLAPFFRTGWQYEWMWAESSLAGGTILAGALVAAFVAHDRAVRQQGIRLLENGTRRGAQSALALPVASLGLAVFAWMLAGVVIWAWVKFHGVSGGPDVWPLTEAASVLTGNVGLGYLVGTYVRSKAAGAVAVFASYLTGSIALYFGLAGVLLQAGGATGSLVGLSRPTEFTLLVVSLNASFGLACICLALGNAPARTNRVGMQFMRAVAVVGLVGVGVFVSRAVADTAPYERSVQVQVCVGKSPSFCAPESGERQLQLVSDSLTSAAEKLEGGGLPLMDSYVLPRGLMEFPSGAGILTMSPESFNEDGASTSDLVMTFGTPADCADAHAAETAMNYLQDQRSVQEWIHTILTEDGPAVPSSVAASYDRLRTCTRYTGWQS